jgi:DNA-binding NarL/FixJ family response regulator
VRVLVADGQAPMRVGLRGVLEAGGLEVCAEAQDAEGAVEASRRERPDVCLIDAELPGGGVVAVRALARTLPDSPVVVMAPALDERQAFEALRAGAAGYLLKDMNPARLPMALVGVLHGEAALPRTLTARLIEHYRGSDRRRLPRLGNREVLTERERDVLEMLVEGSSSGEIAQRLGISAVTVRRHVSEVVRKLEVADRGAAVELVRRAAAG